MQGSLFIVLGTPGSNRRDILRHSINESNPNSASCFIFPPELEPGDLPSTQWNLVDTIFQFEKPEEINEWFLFLSNQLNLADQMEAVLALLDLENDLELARVLTFINSSVINSQDVEFKNWLDACAHFSDIMCFTNRQNENANQITEMMERYKNMRYPMETIILGSKKTPPIDHLLAPVPLRISHIFDQSDILEPDDLPEYDAYLNRQPNKQRIKPVPLFSSLNLYN
jgi:hypothetical protein